MAINWRRKTKVKRINVANARLNEPLLALTVAATLRLSTHYQVCPFPIAPFTKATRIKGVLAIRRKWIIRVCRIRGPRIGVHRGCLVRIWSGSGILLCLLNLAILLLDSFKRLPVLLLDFLERLQLFVGNLLSGDSDGRQLDWS